jgi:hypothetical protein
MWYQITDASNFLRAELFNRQTADETREFLSALLAECVRHDCFRVLISVHSSRPIFSVEKYGLSKFIEIAIKNAAKVAILADSPEIRLAHEYAVMLARLRGVNVRAFRDEAAAAGWLSNGASAIRPRRELAARPDGSAGST